MGNQLPPEGAAHWLTAGNDFRALAELWAQQIDGGEPSGAFAEEDAHGDSLQFRLVEQIEEKILSHYPTSEFEMIIQLEIIAEGIEAGGRSDWLDVRAIRALQDALARQSDDQTVLGWLAGFRDSVPRNVSLGSTELIPIIAP